MGKNAKTYYWFLNYAYHAILLNVYQGWSLVPRYFSIYWIERYKYRLQLQDMNEYVMAKANEKIKTSHV